MAFGSMQRRITELVTADFPNARWVWKTPNAMRNIATGNEVRILLNHAGGYREAIVVIRGLQVCSLTYPHAEEVKMPETENDETGTEETEDDTPQKVDPPENYEYLAFEWVDAHVMELNERCNESIAQGLSMLEITAAELPAEKAGRTSAGSWNETVWKTAAVQIPVLPLISRSDTAERNDAT